jgi:hypothetical protein
VDVIVEIEIRCAVLSGRNGRKSAFRRGGCQDRGCGSINQAAWGDLFPEPLLEFSGLFKLLKSGANLFQRADGEVELVVHHGFLF